MCYTYLAWMNPMSRYADIHRVKASFMAHFMLWVSLASDPFYHNGWLEQIDTLEIVGDIRPTLIH